jgi:hypothetical protein
MGGLDDPPVIEVDENERFGNSEEGHSNSVDFRDLAEFSDVADEDRVE